MGCLLMPSSAAYFNSSYQINDPSAVFSEWSSHAITTPTPQSQRSTVWSSYDHTYPRPWILWSCAPLCWCQALRNACSSRWGGEPNNPTQITGGLPLTRLRASIAKLWSKMIYIKEIFLTIEVIAEPKITQIKKFCFLWNLWDARRFFYYQLVCA